MRLSPRVTTIRPSPIAEAKSWLPHRPEGRALLDLSQAAPSYPTAPVIAERVAEVARSADGGAYAPPLGLPELNGTFAARLSTDDGGDVSPHQVLPTAGCNQAFCVVVSALAEPGDEVIVPLPYYFNHAMWLEAEGFVPRLLEPGDDLVPTTDEAASLINERTRAILLVTPGNPTGVTIPPHVIDAFAELAAANDLALIIDETYRNFRSSDRPPHGQFATPGWDRTVISLHSFSKDLAIPGYRVGAIVAGPSLLEQAAKLLDCMAICAPRIGQEAVLAGLLHAEPWRRDQAARIAHNLDLFRSIMADRPGGFELAAAGAFFGWVRHPFTPTSTAEVVKRLVLDHGVLVIPGTAFRPDDHGWMRFSFANLDGADFSDLSSRLAACGEQLAH